MDFSDFVGLFPRFPPHAWIQTAQPFGPDVVLMAAVVLPRLQSCEHPLVPKGNGLRTCARTGIRLHKVA